jgi:hypothetical protein
MALQDLRALQGKMAQLDLRAVKAQLEHKV